MNVFIITRRELLLFSGSFLAYAAGAIFLFIAGLSFFFTIALHNVATLVRVFNASSIALLFIIPLLTSHLLSTETHSGTLELLLTAPVREWEVVAGKFLAAFIILLLIISPTLVYLLLLVYYANPDILVALAGYIGVILLGAMLIGVGIFASSLSTNQITATLVAIIFSVLFWAAGLAGAVVEGFPGKILMYASFQMHFQDFVAGLITTNNIVYFVSITVAALFVSARILEARRMY